MPADDTGLTGRGLFTWLDTMTEDVAQAKLQELGVLAQRLAWDEFMAGKGPDGGMGLRFSPRAYDALGLTRRTEKYEQRKARMFGGRIIPYVSPGRSGTVHMRDLLRVRGPMGYEAKRIPLGGKRAASTKLTLPGARILNRVRQPFGEKYRQEMLQLKGRALKQGQAIAKRANEIFTALLLAEIQRAPQKTLA